MIAGRFWGLYIGDEDYAGHHLALPPSSDIRGTVVDSGETLTNESPVGCHVSLVAYTEIGAKNDQHLELKSFK